MPLSMPLSVAAGEHREHALIRHLGHAGLIPLVGLSLLVWLVTPDLQAWVALALAAYAALIVSFLGGIPGQYFKQFGLTVAIAVIFSLIVARLITPMMAAYLMRAKDAEEEHRPAQVHHQPRDKNATLKEQI